MVALEDCDHGVGKERHQCVEQLGNNLPTLWNRRRVGELPLDMLLSSGLAVSDDVDLLRIFRNPGGEGSKWQNSHYFTPVISAAVVNRDGRDVREDSSVVGR